MTIILGQIDLIMNGRGRKTRTLCSFRATGRLNKNARGASISESGRSAALMLATFSFKGAMSFQTRKDQPMR